MDAKFNSEWNLNAVGPLPRAIKKQNVKDLIIQVLYNWALDNPSLANKYVQGKGYVLTSAKNIAEAVMDQMKRSQKFTSQLASDLINYYP